MTKLNVLLVKPYNVTDEIQPPLGLGYLATAIRKEHNVEIIDCIKEQMKLNDFKRFLINKKYDLIGMQFYSRDVNIIKKLSKFIKQYSPQTIVVVGGPHPSLAPQFTLDFDPNIDFAFKSESEKGLPLLLEYLIKKDISLSEIPGLVYRDGKKVKINEPYFEEFLDLLGEPSWDLLKPNEYPQAPHGAFFKKYPTAPIIVTRGCPYSCTFCSGSLISGKKIRYHSIDYVIKQIKLLNKQYGINEFHIEDDNFTFNKKFVVEFCERLIKENLDISWSCPNGVRLDTLDEELLKLMKKSGLYSISIGIESGSPRILKLMNKNLSKEITEKKIKLIRKQGLDVIGFFILGYPTETLYEINQTIDFACKLDIQRASFMAFKPFPGTPVTNGLLKEREIKDFDWDNFGLNEIAYSPKGITKKQLQLLRRKALYKFYFRPKIIINMLSSIRSLKQIIFIFKRAMRWLK